MGKLSDDILGFTLDINGNPARKELTEVGNATNKLERDNRALNAEMAKLEAHGKKGSEEWKKYATQVESNNVAIKANTRRMEQLRKEVGLTNLSAGELRKEMTKLKRQMDTMDPNTKEWKALNAQFTAMQGRIGQIRGGMGQTNQVFGAFKKIAPWLGFTALAAGAQQAWSKMIGVRQEFEKYEAVLTNTLGSQRSARRELDMLSDFAAQTPYQLSELTGAFVKLTNYGLKPSRDEMRKYGDLASSVGKGFDQLAEAVADAVTGEFERMKEFGIKAKKEGDKITFTFKEQATVVDNNAQAIRNYITGLGDLQGVTGSMSAISKTMGGAISNLGDAIDRLFNKIGSGAIGTYFVHLTKLATNFIDTLAGKSNTYREDLEQTTIALNNQLTVLKTGNFTADERKRMINEINQEYKDYLPNLLSENATLEEIEGYQNKINQHLQARIIYASYEEEITKILKQQKDSLASNYEIEKKRTELKLGVDKTYQDTPYGNQMNTTLNAVETINNSIINNTGKTVDEIKTKYDSMAQAIGLTFSEIERIAVNATGGKPKNKILPGGKSTPTVTSAPREVSPELMARIEILKVAGNKEKELTDIMMEESNKQIAIWASQLEKEKEFQEAREELKKVQIDAIGQVAGTLAAMFEEGSAAQIAFLAIEKAAAIAQIIFQTGIANAKAVAASPLTFGQPWVAINTVSAGASIAAIVAQTITGFKDKKNNNKPGFADGGYTGRDNNDTTPVGIVHANEFIASAPAVRNPTIKPILDIIDIAQKSGSIRSLNLPAILGKQSGGYTPTNSTVIARSGTTKQPANNYSGLEAAITRLNENIEKGITAKVAKYGHNGLDEAYNDIDKFNSLTK